MGHLRPTSGRAIESEVGLVPDTGLNDGMPEAVSAMMAVPLWSLSTMTTKTATTVETLPERGHGTVDTREHLAESGTSPGRAQEVVRPAQRRDNGIMTITAREKETETDSGQESTPTIDEFQLVSAAVLSLPEHPPSLSTTAGQRQQNPAGKAKDVRVSSQEKLAPHRPLLNIRSSTAHHHPELRWNSFERVAPADTSTATSSILLSAAAEDCRCAQDDGDLPFDIGELS
mmetsp:Transcript_2207/g.5127  ORF Transcript_2207/g.5127 Transcript_2207/m.5127 type:complete len:230 (+) Transcript_2207:227-916(+)